MCGRYRLSRRKQIIEEYFDAADWQDDWSPRYNIAPTQPVPVIRQHTKEPIRQISLMEWGLVPHWAKDASGAASTINARSETAATKPAFRDPLKLRRCLIPADGFYEWSRKGKAKQPFCFEVKDGELFAFAGLWDGWKDSSGQWMKTCSILTTTPNAVTATVHDRMPVILDPDSYDLWLDPGMTNVRVVTELLKPYDAMSMRCYAVDTRVNNTANDDAECSRPVELAETQNRLHHVHDSLPSPVHRPLSLGCQRLRGLPLDMNRIHLECPDSDPSDRSVATDVLVREEPEEDEEDHDEEKDEDEGKEEDGDGYSE